MELQFYSLVITLDVCTWCCHDRLMAGTTQFS